MLARVLQPRLRRQVTPCHQCVQRELLYVNGKYSSTGRSSIGPLCHLPLPTQHHPSPSICPDRVGRSIRNIGGLIDSVSCLRSACYGLHPPAREGRRRGTSLRGGQRRRARRSMPKTLPGNSLTLVSDPPAREGEIVAGVQPFGCALTRRMPDPVALRGLNAYSRFSSRAMARATASASTDTHLSLNRSTLQPMDSSCLCRCTP